MPMSDPVKRTDDELVKRNARTGMYVLGSVVLMIGLSFASVPLYDAFCRVTGWGGTTQVSDALPAQDEVLDRSITVRFDANVARDLPWVFDAETKAVTIQIGARGFANFTSKNLSNKPVAGTALFNVTPLKAGKYFHKIQCFCFDEQILQPAQFVNMPVMFYVDPTIADDPNLDDVKVITLSYSFFRTESKALELATEAFYEGQPVQ